MNHLNGCKITKSHKENTRASSMKVIHQKICHKSLLRRFKHNISHFDWKQYAIVRCVADADDIGISCIFVILSREFDVINEWNTNFSKNYNPFHWNQELRLIECIFPFKSWLSQCSILSIIIRSSKILDRNWCCIIIEFKLT